ncbi:hypothetical protein VN97_g4132 [Penicillium thymicola]|uniref:Uncharacterized protein n=1 Tax=Penicillium thymicola TaxID=293382 RepID=A0AAI9X9M0_PENTH|nr:hypothetical protein VN97_g4132 [Penicillium thymicola]
MAPPARSFSKETDCGSPNAHHSFGIRNPEKMNFTRQSSAPYGPRSYKGNGVARNYRANNNHNGNAPFVPNGPRSYKGNGGARNNRASNNHNGNAPFVPSEPRSYHGNGGARNYRANNNHNGNAPFVPSEPRSYHGNGGARNNRANNNHNGNAHFVPNGPGSYQGNEASDEPDDVEMPDAPPLLDPVSDLWEAASGLQHALTSLQRIEAFTMGALAVREIVSPSVSYFQFNSLAFLESAMDPLVSTHPTFGISAFHPPAFYPKIIASPKLQGNTECNYFL